MGSRLWLRRAGVGLAVAAVGGGAALYMLPSRFSLFSFLKYYFLHTAQQVFFILIFFISSYFFLFSFVCTYCLSGMIENGNKNENKMSTCCCLAGARKTRAPSRAELDPLLLFQRERPSSLLFEQSSLTFSSLEAEPRDRVVPWTGLNFLDKNFVNISIVPWTARPAV